MQSNLPNPESAWYLTACKRNDDSELYICHTAEADEESIISEWYGHIKMLAETMKEGVDSVEGMEGVIYQVPESLNEEVLTKMQVVRLTPAKAPKPAIITNPDVRLLMRAFPPAKADYPIIDSHTLDEADGILFGFPTRFGIMAAQILLDTLSQMTGTVNALRSSEHCTSFQ
eukprot:gene1652-33045_t